MASYSPFQNDQGRELVEELVRSTDPDLTSRLVHLALRVAHAQDAPEVDESCGAVAASCLIAVCAGAPVPNVPGISAWLATCRTLDLTEVRPLARSILERALNEELGQWHEQWSERELPAVKEQLRTYFQALVDEEPSP